MTAPDDAPSPAPPDSPLRAVETTAALARLRLEPGEAARLGEDFARILEAFQDLAEVDVEGVPPLASAADLVDVLRPDEPRPSLPRDVLLARAPSPAGEGGAFFGVPKTVETDS